MATQVQFRRGTTVQHSSFTGAQGEVTVDTDKKTVVVHDGTTAGGRPVPTLTGAEVLTNKTLTAPAINGTVTTTGLTLPAVTLGGTVTSNGQSFSGTIANLGTVTTADINGGTIDGTVIGGDTRAAGSFVALSATGVATFGVSGTTTITNGGGVTTTGVGGFLAVQGTGSPSAGAGLELNGGAGDSFIQGYNRTGAAYIPVSIKASQFLFKHNGSTTVLDASSTGLDVTGTLSATEATTFGTAASTTTGLSVIDTLDASSTTAASLKTAGGLGVAKKLYVGDNIVMASGKALQTVAGYVEGSEMTAPAAPSANGFRIYAEDNGSGKTRLMVKFATGAAQQLAIEP